MPASASVTTVVGSLISFFMVAILLCRSWRSGDRLGHERIRDVVLGHEVDRPVEPACGRSPCRRRPPPHQRTARRRRTPASAPSGRRLRRLAARASGRSTRAGLIAAAVAGATGMMAANTTRPIATPAKPGGGLAVDDAEDHEHQDERADELGAEALQVPDAQGLLNDATPRPTSCALEPSTPTIASAPMVAPTTWAAM